MTSTLSRTSLSRHIRDSHSKPEVILYLIVWALLILSIPAVRLFEFWHSDTATSIDWTGIGFQYAHLIPFALLFLFNDLFLAPIIVRRRKVLLYVLLALLSAIFLTFALETLRSLSPSEPLFRGGPQVEGQARRGDNPPPRPFGDDFRPDADDFDSNPPPRPDSDFQPAGEPHMRGGVVGPLRVGPMIGDLVLAILTLCAGTLVKLYLITDRDKERLRRLDKERTEAQLAQLRYQVSPHFMMNTLNNIHALVDIDSERAKETIERLSNLMRYVLYDGGKPTVTLQSEVDFIRGYVQLMSLRFTDSVSITLDLPSSLPSNLTLPPLLFVNIVENAFKHGVSYLHPSFVDIRLSLSPDADAVNFCCTNSLSNSSPADSNHGIGLANTRKRLEPMCPGRFQLSALQLSDRYVVTLAVSLLPGE